MLVFKNWTYPWGPYAALILNSVLVLVQGWSSFSPKFSGVDFVSYYIELPIMLVMFVGWKLIKRTKWVRLDEMDLVTDVYTANDEEIDHDEKTTKGRFKRALNWLF